MNQYKTLDKGCFFIVALLFMVMFWSVQSYADINVKTDKVTIGLDNLSDGWISVRYDGDVDAKAILYHDGNKEYTYSLSQETGHIIPTAYGNGEYSLSVYERIHDNEYVLITSRMFDVSLKDELSPFLYPNTVVDYNDDMALIKTADRLREQHPETSDYISSVYYFVSQYDYDYEKASKVSVEKDYISDVEHVYHEQKGICYDYAAVMVAMLRSQGVPAKIEFGFVDEFYHAWVNVYQYDGLLGSYAWKLYDPTFAASTDSSTISACMYDPENYKPIYVN